MSEGRRGHAKRAGIAALLGATALMTGLLFAPPAGAVAPGFTKVFAPDTINPDGISTLTFTIDNTANGTTTDNLSFTDTFPTNVVVANPTGASTTCTDPGGAIYTPVVGAGSITFSGWNVAANASCTVEVDVTSATPGSYVNTSSVLTSDDEPDGPGATDTLEVVSPPDFSKAFSPDTIDPDGISTLTFTIDNTGNTLAEGNLDFTDTFPTSPGAMVLATPANASTDCSGGSLTATDGAASFSYTGGTVPADSICTVQVDVTAPTAGTYENTSGILTSDAGSSGTASDSLVVTPLVVTKTFVEGSITSGGTATFNIIIRNDGTEPLIDIAADDPLAPECNRAAGSLATLNAGTELTYTCTLANVTASFTNTITVTAVTDPSAIVVSGVATAAVTVAAPTTTPTTAAAAAAGPVLALTGSSTGPLTGIGLGIVALGALLVLSSSNRRRLFRRT